jgi:hypothetical protein
MDRRLIDPSNNTIDKSSMILHNVISVIKKGHRMHANKEFFEFQPGKLTVILVLLWGAYLYWHEPAVDPGWQTETPLMIGAGFGQYGWTWCRLRNLDTYEYHFFFSGRGAPNGFWWHWSGTHQLVTPPIKPTDSTDEIQDPLTDLRQVNP